MVSADDIAIFPDVLGDPRDGSGFLVVECLVKEEQSIFDFCLRNKIPSRRVCICCSSLAGACSG